MVDDIKSDYKDIRDPEPRIYQGTEASGRIKIEEYLYNPTRERLSELTKLPLDQIRSHSLIGTLGEMVRQACREAVERQKKMNSIFVKYNKDSSGTGIIPVDLEKDNAWIITNKDIFSETWSYKYKQHRRSVGGELLMDSVRILIAKAQEKEGIDTEEILKGITKEG